mmetsp:Transcript_41279/g.127524  ORF Transcript_41279/g.127524 Transcript_41279/m.127524 type:complete len:284 (+) Transcript_41279:282-1133(+)
MAGSNPSHPLRIRKPCGGCKSGSSSRRRGSASWGRCCSSARCSPAAATSCCPSPSARLSPCAPSGPSPEVSRSQIQWHRPARPAGSPLEAPRPRRQVRWRRSRARRPAAASAGSPESCRRRPRRWRRSSASCSWRSTCGGCGDSGKSAFASRRKSACSASTPPAPWWRRTTPRACRPSSRPPRPATRRARRPPRATAECRPRRSPHSSPATLSRRRPRTSCRSPLATSLSSTISPRTGGAGRASPACGASAARARASCRATLWNPSCPSAACSVLLPLAGPLL